MRFRSTISDIVIFTRLVGSLERLGKNAWLRLTPSSVHVIVLPASQGTQVWSNFRPEVLFEHDYICLSNAEDTINLEIPLDTLSRALKSCSASAETAIRLTKKNNTAYLAISTTVMGKLGGHENVITHLVPTNVLQSEYVQREKEPTLPSEDVHIMLPSPVDTLRAVSERYKSLSEKLFVLANMAGELKLRVESDEVKVETKWTGLVNPPLDPSAVNLAEHPSTSRPPNVFSEIKIDAKDWANLLRVSVVARSMLACICVDRALVVYVYITEDTREDGPMLTYYIPAHA